MTQNEKFSSFILYHRESVELRGHSPARTRGSFPQDLRDHDTIYRVTGLIAKITIRNTL